MKLEASVGTLLKQIRTGQSWTLGKLAQQSGVSKSALSQWEADKRQPRIVELDAVLNALHVSASQRALVLARIDAPRAIRQLRQQGTAGRSVAPPTAGDLLRAMRLRKQWSQERLASLVGVARVSVLRWEQGERLPDTVQMQRLCYALDAQEEELLALTQGSFFSPASSPSSWKEQKQMLEERLKDLLWSGGELWELRWLTLEQDAWQLTMQFDSVKPLLVRILTGHARYNRNREQWSEIEMRMQKAFALISSQQIERKTRLVAMLMQTAARVHTGSRLAPEWGIKTLQDWLASTTDPAFTAWILADMAKYAAMMQWQDTSLTLANKACQIAERGSSLTEVSLRRHDYGRLLLDAGRPSEALHILPPSQPASVWAQIELQLLRVEAHQQLGHSAEAHDLLQEAGELITAHREIETWRLKAELLAQRF